MSYFVLSGLVIEEPDNEHEPFPIGVPPAVPVMSASGLASMRANGGKRAAQRRRALRPAREGSQRESTGL